MQKRLIGKIIKPQGIKGELKIYPYTKNIEIFKNVKVVYLGQTESKTKVVKITPRLGFVYLTIENLTDRTEAEKYRGIKVYTDESELETNSNLFFVDDLIDCYVYDENNNFIGSVVDVENYGATDIIIILGENKREYSLPFIKSIFVEVSKDKIVVNKEKYDEVVICD